MDFFGKLNLYTNLWLLMSMYFEFIESLDHFLSSILYVLHLIKKHGQFWKQFYAPIFPFKKQWKSIFKSFNWMKTTHLIKYLVLQIFFIAQPDHLLWSSKYICHLYYGVMFLTSKKRTETEHILNAKLFGVFPKIIYNLNIDYSKTCL